MKTRASHKKSANIALISQLKEALEVESWVKIMKMELEMDESGKVI